MLSSSLLASWKTFLITSLLLLNWSHRLYCSQLCNQRSGYWRQRLFVVAYIVGICSVAGILSKVQIVFQEGDGPNQFLLVLWAWQQVLHWLSSLPLLRSFLLPVGSFLIAFLCKQEFLTARQKLLIITTNYVFIYLVGTLLIRLKHNIYIVWLPPDSSSGVFIMMPQTGRCFTIQQDGFIPSLLLCFMEFQTIGFVLMKYLMISVFSIHQS